MQLKLQRSQRPGGIVGKTVIFCLDARADYSAPETANIAKYKLGGQVVYNSQSAKQHLANMDQHLNRVDSDRMRDQAAGLVRGVASLALAKMNLNISIASLGRGHHIECKDLPELLDAEKTLMDACRSLKQFLEAAATFNGSIILVDFDDGEKVHVAQGALELQALPAPEPAISSQVTVAHEDVTSRATGEPFGEMGRLMHATYARQPKLVAIGGALAASLIILLLFGINLLTLLIAVSAVVTAYIWTKHL
jgi:hypothetical protein